MTEQDVVVYTPDKAEAFARRQPALVFALAQVAYAQFAWDEVVAKNLECPAPSFLAEAHQAKNMLAVKMRRFEKELAWAAYRGHGRKEDDRPVQDGTVDFARDFANLMAALMTLLAHRRRREAFFHSANDLVTPEHAAHRIALLDWRAAFARELLDVEVTSCVVRWQWQMQEDQKLTNPADANNS